jgi:hypothetical protein
VRCSTTSRSAPRGRARCSWRDATSAVSIPWSREAHCRAMKTVATIFGTAGRWERIFLSESSASRVLGAERRTVGSAQHSPIVLQAGLRQELAPHVPAPDFPAFIHGWRIASFAARFPLSTAPHMKPGKSSLVCSPAKSSRPSSSGVAQCSSRPVTWPTSGQT